MHCPYTCGYKASPRAVCLPGTTLSKKLTLPSQTQPTVSITESNSCSSVIDWGSRTHFLHDKILTGFTTFRYFSMSSSVPGYAMPWIHCFILTCLLVLIIIPLSLCNWFLNLEGGEMWSCISDWTFYWYSLHFNKLYISVLTTNYCKKKKARNKISTLN